jgi:hypothetical protein
MLKEQRTLVRLGLSNVMVILQYRRSVASHMTKFHPVHTLFLHYINLHYICNIQKVSDITYMHFALCVNKVFKPVNHGHT